METFKDIVKVNFLPLMLILQALTGWGVFFWLGAAWATILAVVLALVTFAYLFPTKLFRMKLNVAEVPVLSKKDKFLKWFYRLTMAATAVVLFWQGHFALFAVHVLTAANLLAMLYLIRKEKKEAEEKKGESV